VLLAPVFAVGTGQALTSPTWQTLQPELVSPPERPQAISLGSVNQNLARAVGPAIGGLLLAATNAGTVFLIKCATRWPGSTRSRARATPTGRSRSRTSVRPRRTSASQADHRSLRRGWEHGSGT
jgi:MFS family permease